MRYRKGTIALSDTRDYPLLRRVLHCGFVTSAQLYEFMRLDYCAASRNAFDNRLRRWLHRPMALMAFMSVIFRPAMARAISAAGTGAAGMKAGFTRAKP